MRSSKQLYSSDPYNTFDWIMDLSDQHKTTSAFYFFGGRTCAPRDADYDINHPAIRSLMRHIHDRGHEIGLHPSYNTYQEPEAIATEAQQLRNICSAEGIQQKEWGGRMHYLRWEHPTTLYGWEQAKMTYDSTLGYADHPGFRCGTCFEYPAFDPIKQKRLNIRIRPLIAMDSSVVSPLYLGLGTGAAAYSKFIELKECCRKVKGSFTLLWHNSELITPEMRRLYEKVLSS